MCVEICCRGFSGWCAHGEAVAGWVYCWLVGNPVVDYLPGFDGECAMEEGGRERDLGRTKDTFLGVEHVPREPSFEGGREIDKQEEAMALLVERGIVSRVGHFRL